MILKGKIRKGAALAKGYPTSWRAFKYLTFLFNIPKLATAYMIVQHLFHQSRALFQVIAAEGEQKASKALREAAGVIAESPSALQVNTGLPKARQKNKRKLPTSCRE